MTCKTCGAKLSGQEKFCRFCGTPLVEEPQQPQQIPYPYQGGQSEDSARIPHNPYAQNPVNRQPAWTPVPQDPPGGYSQPHDWRQSGNAPYSAPSQPKASKAPKAPKAPGKRPGKGLIIGAVAGVAVLAVVLVVVLLLTGSPLAKVTAALASTAKEYTAVGDALQLQLNPELLKGEEVSQDLDIQIHSVNDAYVGPDASIFSGLGLRMKMDMSLSQRDMALEVTPYLGSAEILDVLLAAKNDTLYFGLPQLLPDNYGINTVTFMKDLAAMGAQLGDVAGISFNIFDIVEMVKAETEAAQPDTEAITAASVELLKTLKAEKEGKGSIRVNGSTVKAATYRVTVPQDALEIWLDEVEEASGSGVNISRLTRMVLTEIGLPGHMIDEVMYELDLTEGGPQTDMGAVRDLLEEIGDLELEISIADGKVAAVVFSEKIDGEKVKISLHLGGGEVYADDLSLEVKIGDDKVILESTGDHTARDGSFTDETVLTVETEYSSNSMVVYTEYDPESSGDNLSVTVEMPDGSAARLRGRLSAWEDGLEIGIDSLVLVDKGEEMMTLGLEYSLMPYESRIKVFEARLLSDMSQLDLLAALTKMEQNAEDWITDLTEKFPDLVDLF